MFILLTQGTLESHVFVWKWKFHLLLRNTIQSIVFLCLELYDIIDKNNNSGHWVPSFYK